MTFFHFEIYYIFNIYCDLFKLVEAEQGLRCIFKRMLEFLRKMMEVEIDVVCYIVLSKSKAEQVLRKLKEGSVLGRR